MDNILVGNIIEGLRRINEGKIKPAFGSVRDGDKTMMYAVKVEGLDNQDFLNQAFGRQLEDLKKINEFKKTAKKDWIGVKKKNVKSSMAEMKKWVKSVNPSEFYAKWADSPTYWDDSIEVFYKE